MQKRHIASSLALSLLATLAAAPAVTLAQAAPAPAATPEWTISGNAGLFSDYRFRGFTQTGYRPAFQGGIDVAHSSGFYVGNWNSNVEQALFRGASLEMDLYGGYKFSAGPVGMDVGYIHYFYPTSNSGGLGKVKNGEFYIGASYGIFSAKYYYGVTNFFGAGDGTATDTDGSSYLDLGVAYDLGGGWGINGHYGYQRVKNGTTVGLPSNHVSDYKIGVTKDLSGWLLSGSIIGTSKKNYFLTGASLENGGKTRAVVSLSKTF